MEQKINAFSGIPASELTSLGKSETMKPVQSSPASVESDFNQTNQHTKQTADSTQNTPNPQNTPTNTSATTNTGDKNRLGKIMSGKFAVTLVDMLLPGLLVILFNWIGYKILKKEFQLSKDEKEELAPAIQECLDSIHINFDNPVVNLSIMLGIVYGSKIIDKVPTMEKKESTGKTGKESISVALAKTVSAAGEDGEPESDIEQFETQYAILVDETKNARRRGVGDAKQYLAQNFPEKIKALAKKYKVPLPMLNEKLNYTHEVKRRGKNNQDIKIP